MPTEQDELLGYDADHEDPRQYCVHGTFIGSWWGPDYLCHACEMGISPAAYRYSNILDGIRRWEDKLGWFARLADHAGEICADKNPTYQNHFRNIVVDLVLTKYDECAAILRNIAQAQGQLVYFWLEHPDFDPEDDSQWGY